MTLNFPVLLLRLVSEQFGVFNLSHDSECDPRRKQNSKTLFCLIADLIKHTEEMWAARAGLSNTYSGKNPPHFSLWCRRFCTGERSDSSEGDNSLPCLCSPSLGKHVKGWRARVLSGHAVRGTSVRELLWTSLSVLGRSAAGDGITGRISERRDPLREKSSDRRSEIIPRL